MTSCALKGSRRYERAHPVATAPHDDMRYCSVCENMLYISLRPDERKDGSPLELTYSCKHCGFAITADEVRRESEAAGKDRDASAVLSTDYSDDQTSYKQYATPYIRHDPTLPRVNDVVCPSERCTRPPDAPNEVIYVKYDAANLKYLYHCNHCSSFWKSGGGTV
jgi:hypothetical protein